METTDEEDMKWILFFLLHVCILYERRQCSLSVRDNAISIFVSCLSIADVNRITDTIHLSFVNITPQNITPENGEMPETTD